MKTKQDLCNCGKEKDVRSKQCSYCYCHRPKNRYYCECGTELADYRATHCLECSLTIHHPQKGKMGESAPNYKGGKSKHYCLDCKCEIGYYAERCWECYVRWAQIPTNNPNYVHGNCYLPYPLGWTNTFKEQIRFRDNYKCQLCGCHEVENCRKLDVHHIDYNKENLKEDNLISLCQKCHGKTNFNREYWFKILKDRFCMVKNG